MLLRYEHPSLNLDTTLLTVNPYEKTFTVHDPGGTQADLGISSWDLLSKERASSVMDSLAAGYMAMGSGWHTVEAIAEQTKLDPKRLRVDLGFFSRMHLHGLLDVEMSPRNYYASAVHFGNLALASEIPSAEAVAAADAKVAAKAAKLEEQKVAILEAEPTKTDLTAMDHAIIEVRGVAYYMPLNSRLTILASRVIETLARSVGQPQPILLRDLARAIWRAMPVAERQLYSTADKEIYKLESTRLLKEVDSIAMELASARREQLGIATRLFGDRYQLTINREDVRVSYHAEEYEDTTSAVPIFPPGTDRDIVDGATLQAMEDFDLAKANEAITHIRAAGRYGKIGHDDAVAMLDFIMSRSGKDALRAALSGQNAANEYTQMRDRLHLLLARSLGYGAYRGAVRNRTIAGNAWTYGSRSVHQVGGRLPVTTKWHTGIRSNDAQIIVDRSRKQ